MIAYERSKSAREILGKFIHQFQPETKTHQESWKDPNEIK